MKISSMSRRTLLEASACVMASVGVPQAAGADTGEGPSPNNEQAIRKYYAAWERRDWRPLDLLLTDDFTFTSANDDDHISKSVFKQRCWESQIDYIDRFDLQHVVVHGDEAFVLYVCRIKGGKTFRNVEYLRLRHGKVASVECYFGQKLSFPSAVATGQL